MSDTNEQVIYEGRFDEVDRARQAVIDSDPGCRQVVLWWYANACVRAGDTDASIIAHKLEEAYSQSLARHEGGTLDTDKRRECLDKARAALKQDNRISTEAPRQTKSQRKLQALQRRNMQFWEPYVKGLLDTDVDTSMFMDTDGQEYDCKEIQRRVLKLVWRNKSGWYFAGRQQDSKFSDRWHKIADGIPELSQEDELFTPNPFCDEGSRTKDNVIGVNWVILEMDEPLDASRIEARQGTMAWKKAVLEQQKAFWAHVLKLGVLQVGALIYSGGKSIHALVRVNANTEEFAEHTPRLKELCWDLHLDPNDIGCERTMRTPCAMRHYKKLDEDMLVDIEEWRTAYNKPGVPVPPTYNELQAVLYINEEAEPMSLEDLEGALEDLTGEFMPKYDNAWKDAIEKGTNLTFTSDHCAAYLEHKGMEVIEDVIMRKIVFSGFRRDGNNGKDENGENAISTDMDAAKRQIADDWLDGLGQKLQLSDVKSVLIDVAKMRRVNPVIDWLDGLKYQGKIDMIEELCSILGLASDDTLHRTLVRKWLRQCVAMVFNPEVGRGTQYGADGVLTLVGAQGLGKTSLFRALCPKQNWFREGRALDTENKDSLIQLLGGWIMELGELRHTTGKDQDLVKAIITASDDEIRLVYGEAAVRTARHVSLCATVNGDEFLRDNTGNRRWWVIPVSSLDVAKIEWLHNNVDQLWAQVYSEIKAMQLTAPQGEQGKVMATCFRLTPEERAALEMSNCNYRREIEWEAEILTAYNFDAPKSAWHWKQAGDVARYVWRNCKYGDANFTHKTIIEVGKALKSLNMEHRRTRQGIEYLMPPCEDDFPRNREDVTSDDTSVDTAPAQPTEAKAMDAATEQPAAAATPAALTEDQLLRGPVEPLFHAWVAGELDDTALNRVINLRMKADGDWQTLRSRLYDEKFWLKNTGKLSDQLTMQEAADIVAREQAKVGKARDEGSKNNFEANGTIQRLCQRLEELCQRRGWNALEAQNMRYDYSQKYKAEMADGDDAQAV